MSGVPYGAAMSEHLAHLREEGQHFSKRGVWHNSTD